MSAAPWHNPCIVPPEESLQARVENTREGVLAGKQLLPREIASLVLRNGWLNYEKVLAMVQIVYAESLGFTEAVGGPNSNGSYDYGIVQLNSSHAAGWGFSEDEFGAMAFAPEQAFMYARKLYIGGGYDFGAWAAFSNGAYNNPVFRLRAIQGVANASAERAGYTPVPKFATRG